MNQRASSPYAGRRALIVTKHQKEQVLLPLLYERLGMDVEILMLDTDAFGTFDGEIERQGTQLDALHRKLEAARTMIPSDDAVIVASEGAFFPHPDIPIITLNRELVGLDDRNGNLTIVGEAQSLQTNMLSRAVSQVEELEATLVDLAFPSHAAIVRDGDRIHKGIDDAEELTAIVRASWDRGMTPIIESDMRAFCNPTRMGVIRDACKNLTDRVLSACPMCARPGFWISSAIAGLPCVRCGGPSVRTRAFLWTCNGCGRQDERACSGAADPGDCPLCNP